MATATRHVAGDIPNLSPGTVTSIFTIGSKRLGLACWKTLRKAIEAAVLKACSELSTG